MSVLSPQQLQQLNSTTAALAEEYKATNQNKGAENSQNNSVDPNTSNIPALEYFKPNPKNYTFEARTLGASLGFIVGLGYAFKVKSGFWKGWGYTILGSMALGGLGYGIGMAIKKKNKNGEG